MLWIIEVTQLRPGAMNATLLQLADAQALSDAEKVVCLITEGQEEPPPDWEWDIVKLPADVAEDDGKLSVAVMQNLEQLASDYPRVCVVSLRNPVKNVAQMFAITSGIEVETLSLAPYVPPKTAAEEAEVWEEDFMPREQAARALVRALSRQSGTPQMTHLRGILIREDRKFEKLTGSFSARPRFMSALVGVAEAEGLVKRRSVPGSPSNPRVELTAKGRQLLVASGPVRPKTLVAPLIGAGKDDITDQKVETRSDMFITTLRKDGFGPFQEVRLAAYEVMGGLLTSGQPTVQVLLRDTVAGVRDRATELIKSNKPFPWSRFRSFLSGLLARTSVLLHNQTPITYAWSEVDVAVTGLAEDWQLALDGELICRLLELGVEIDLEDTVDLAGALYNSRRDQYFDRVLDVERHLFATGRVRENARVKSRFELVSPETLETE
jgi:DNA-binding HxlR family transcriptional regulator